MGAVADRPGADGAGGVEWKTVGALRGKVIDDDVGESASGDSVDELHRGDGCRGRRGFAESGDERCATVSTTAKTQAPRTRGAVARARSAAGHLRPGADPVPLDALDQPQDARGDARVS